MKTPKFLRSTLGLVCCAGAALAAGCAIFHAHVFRSAVGLQLYSVRTQMAKDPDGTLAEVHSWGIKYVELAGNYGLSPQDFKAKLSDHGLDAVSGHFPFERWDSNPEGVLLEARDLGLIDVGCAWIPHSGKFDEATCQHAIEVFNKAGKMAAEHHMQFFYHTHGYEFEPYKGGTMFDHLLEQTDSSNVKFEMDIFWIVHAARPVHLLRKYPWRWEAMHLKDMRKGTPTGLLTGSSDVRNDVALGKGIIDLPAILTAAREDGIKWYFIEDESPTSEEQIPQSLVYLRDLRY